MWMELSQLLKDIFYPNCCLECERPTNTNSLFCSHCRKNLTKMFYNYEGKHPYSSLENYGYLYAYDGCIRTAFHQIKYAGAKHLLPRMSAEVRGNFPWADIQRKWLLPESLVVVPISTEPRRKKQRGYDIPREIFHLWSIEQHLPWEELLLRKEAVAPQYGLNKTERYRNVKDSFRAVKAIPNYNILLVDDIFTTGATMEEAARTLKAAGASHVWGIAFSGDKDK